MQKRDAGNGVGCSLLYTVFWGRRFIVRTDHAQLFVMVEKLQGTAAGTGSLVGHFWLSMTFPVQHRPAWVANADALSRLPCKQCGLQTSIPLQLHGLPDAVKKGESGDGVALLQEGSVCFLSFEDPKQLQDKLSYRR